MMNANMLQPQMDEFDFIATLLRPLAVHSPEALDLRDDAALLHIPQGKTLVITKDAISAGVHFIGDEPAADIARKLLRCNLSDLSAMGAEPYGYFLALMLPQFTDDAWLRDFADGLRADQDRYGMALMGGDTIRTHGTLALSATFLGLVPEGEALRRNGAQEGDGVYVSGTLGDAALGLKVAQNETGLAALDGAHRAWLLDRYRLPQPRITLGMGLRGIATACMDVSDGLVQDMEHLAEASGLGAVIEADSIPLSESAKAALAHMSCAFLPALAGGDDYELLFTVPAAEESSLAALALQAKTNVTRIGHMTRAGNLVHVIDAGGTQMNMQHKGYRHGKKDR